jgi:lipopolysaccharide biosynthesis regulator YciM
MEFDFTWLLFGLPIAFALGWMASRLDMRQMRIENREDPKAYFRGLNHLLNEQQDQAIDAFVQAVQNDPDTSELHFALGNLFRRRGEYDRAVKVHAHLVARADLSKADHERALNALSLDYMRAGLLDRAEAALRDLEGTTYEAQARRTRLMIYERSREWQKALELCARMEQAEGSDLHQRRAHHWCEMAAEAKEPSQAEALLHTALEVSSSSVRARMALAELHASKGRFNEALDALLPLSESQAEALLLVAQPMATWALGGDKAGPVRAVLERLYEQTQSADALEALGILGGSADAAREAYIAHLQRKPSMLVATKWIEGEKFEHEEFHPQVQKALDSAVQPLKRYRCGSCGFEAKRYFWQCPGCQSWDSYAYKRVEEL